MLSQCEHVRAADPRMRDCVKCGRPIPKGWDRDVARENALITHSTASKSVAELVNFRRLARSGLGSVRRIFSRPFAKEADEELLDFFNYAVWLDQQRRLHGFDGLSVNKRHALSLVLEGYEWWHRVEDEE